MKITQLVPTFIIKESLNLFNREIKRTSSIENESYTLDITEGEESLKFKTFISDRKNSQGNPKTIGIILN